MFVFYSEKNHIDIRERHWHMYAYDNSNFYQIELHRFSFDTDENNGNIQEEFFYSENEKFLKFWFWNFQKKGPLEFIPYRKSFSYKKQTSPLRKIVDFTKGTCCKPLLMKHFIYEFAYLNRNIFKYICFVDYSDFHDEIVDDSTSLHYNTEKSYHLIRNFLKRKFPSSITNKIYSNNTMLLVEDDNTLLKLKLHLGCAIVKIFDIESFLKLWSKLRVAKEYILPHHYMHICHNSKVAKEIIKNAKKIDINECQIVSL